MDPLTDGFAELPLESFHTGGFGLVVPAREPDRVWLADVAAP